MLRLALATLRYRTGGFAASFVAVFLGATILMGFAALLDTATARGVTGESRKTLITLAGAALAILLAALAGRLLLTVLASTRQVGAGVAYRFGPAALSMGLGITLAAATIAAILAAARITRMRAAESVVAASTGRARMSKAQIVCAGLIMAGGLGLGILRGVTAVLAGPLQRVTGVSGYLTVLNARQRTGQLATALMPIIVLTGIATGTLYMQSIENRATAAAGLAKSADQHAGRGDGPPQAGVRPAAADTTIGIYLGVVAVAAAVTLAATVGTARPHAPGSRSRSSGDLTPREAGRAALRDRS
jgi:hypothetical protein